MADPTPKDMLEIYRREMTEFSAKQVSWFRKLSQDDRMELLFRMSLNLGSGLQHVHSLIDPDNPPETSSMPEPPRKN